MLMMTPEQVDAIARGEESSELYPRLSSEELRDYEECKARRYMVRDVDDGFSNVEIMYPEWCAARGLPMMKILYIGNLASVSVHTNPFSVTSRLDRQTLARVVRLCQPLSAVADSVLCCGENRLRIWGLPRAKAPAVAARIWKYIRFSKTGDWAATE